MEKIHKTLVIAPVVSMPPFPASVKVRHVFLVTADVPLQ